VADALERRYLRKVFFGLSSDREGKDLLEEVRPGGVVGLWVLRLMLGAASWWVLGAGLCCYDSAPSRQHTCAWQHPPAWQHPHACSTQRSTSC
jgi:hypothetical protein